MYFIIKMECTCQFRAGGKNKNEAKTAKYLHFNIHSPRSVDYYPFECKISQRL